MAGYIGAQGQIRSGLSATIDELNIIDGVTATTAELNIIDGVTATTAELNILDGVTSTAAELNILDGVTSTAAELNILDGVTATAAEINLIDGGTARGTTAVADGDGFLTNDGGTMRMTKVDTLATYMGTKIGGGLEFIASVDLDNAATANFTGFDSSKYDAYRFVFSNVVPATDNVSLDVRTSTDGGSNYDAGSNQYRMNRLKNGTNLAYSATAFGVGVDIGSDSGENGTSGELIVFGPHLVQNTYLIVQSLNDSNTGALVSLYNTGFRTSVADVDALQFLAGSGNLESGTITMYGMVNS